MNKINEWGGTANAGTGPQGTRVFRRDEVERQIAAHQPASIAAAVPATGATLLGTRGVLEGQRIDIPASRSTIGRDAANNIVINDDSISLVHARLIEKDGAWRVLNLLSTNGTWINSRKVSDGVLQHGDTVCFGQAEFVFEIATVPRPDGLWRRLRRWVATRRRP